MPEFTPEKLRPSLVAVTDGPWRDWFHFEPSDAFEDYTGPFYCRPEGDAGALVCGFIPELKNANAGGSVHGGALMTFADFALFIIAGGINYDLHGVTVTMNCEFVGAAQPGRLLSARGEVVRAGFSMVFVRGIIDDNGRAVLAFSGTIKRIKPRT
jgi:acyl-coenzyme A thioesterase PaaI-like protein